MTNPPKHIFGPVPSRRLGRSLGVDVVPFKTCTYDCIYCELGRTTDKTVLRCEYAALDDVVTELDDRLKTIPAPDYITLAGSGEPTLYSRLGELIGRIKQKTSIPLAVLTNGSLFWDAEVRNALAQADLVLPSLDAGDDNAYQKINRPHSSIAFETMAAGLEAFRREYSKPVWLEVLLVGGITDSDQEVEKIARLAKRIQPDRVQLNTAVRPAAEHYARIVPAEKLHELANHFHPLPVDCIAEFHGGEFPSGRSVPDGEIISLLQRRPCTLKDIAESMGGSPRELQNQLKHLCAAGQIAIEKKQNRYFYIVQTH